MGMRRETMENLMTRGALRSEMPGCPGEGSNILGRGVLEDPALSGSVASGLLLCTREAGLGHFSEPLSF